MKTQKEAVFEVITKKFGFKSEKYILTVDQKRDVAEIVTTMMENAECRLKPAAFDKYNTHELLRDEYVMGMVNNWLMKDERLNGGIEHEIKNPGSRSKDEILKNLKALKAKCVTEAEKQEVESAIQARQTELDAKKSKKKDVEIDETMIPESLRYLLKKKA